MVRRQIPDQIPIIYDWKDNPLFLHGSDFIPGEKLSDRSSKEQNSTTEIINEQNVNSTQIKDIPIEVYSTTDSSIEQNYQIIPKANNHYLTNQQTNISSKENNPLSYNKNTNLRDSSQENIYQANNQVIERKNNINTFKRKSKVGLFKWDENKDIDYDQSLDEDAIKPKRWNYSAVGKVGAVILRLLYLL